MPPVEARRIAARFGIKGRVGRLSFLGWNLSLALCVWVWVAAIAAAAKMLHVDGFVRAEVAAVLAAAPVVWLALVIQVKRLHDLDFSGWHSLWIWVLPIVPTEADGTIGTVLRLGCYGVMAWMCLAPGSPGPNRFGAAPGPLPAR
ncbi:hypothetical protein GCM10009416_24160 [Craurococcus roseus]|uniref:DUF805 domain-containing protein n=2 Tax=Craurococcus roseus TaxID=77585 RepID=A0ABP3QBX1_9PROT